MQQVVSISAIAAVGVAVVAALFDSARGEIPNQVTIPAFVLAPLAYGSVFGFTFGIHSLGAGLLAGLPPYLLFRSGAMGGGDVKLFASLGAIQGYDLLAGLKVQVWAFAFALFAVGVRLAWRGRLISTLGRCVVVSLAPVLPPRLRRAPTAELCQPIRMGGPILSAIAVVSSPHLMRELITP